MGMIGGGKKRFYGAIHRIAANMDGLMNSIVVLLVLIRNIYRIWKRFVSPNQNVMALIKMLVTESKLPLRERMDFVSIVT
jgi:hypothetical protein